VAVAILAGFDLTLGAVASAVVMVAGINLVHRRARLAEDTGIGLLFVGMLAAGVAVISRVPSYAGSLTAILFGDILAVSATDLAVLGSATLVAIVATVVLYRPFLTLSFNEQKAELLGMMPRLAHFAMIGLIALTVVTSFRTVGSLLVFGLIIAPPATACLVANRVPRIMLTALGLGTVAVVGGLLLSYHLGTAGSASIAALAVALFFVVLTIRGRRRGAGVP
jgi:ABC-type Mn2+/Zn2+ transport system permease subunit